MEREITLIQTTYTKDAILQDVAVETRREVMALIISATRTEWVSAGQNNYRADLVAITPFVNYDGERIVEVEGVRYSVYRRYLDEDTDDIELYLQEEGGVRG